MGGVCVAEDTKDDIPVLVQKDMKTVQEEMARYKSNMQKSEAEKLKSLQRYGKAKGKIQQFKKRHANSPKTENFLNVDENEVHHMRGDSFTRASAAASAERFAEFKSKLDEEKRRSRRPIEDHREDVQRKMHEISTKGAPVKNQGTSKSRDRSSKKRKEGRPENEKRDISKKRTVQTRPQETNEDKSEDNEKRDAKKSRSKKRRSGESRKKDKDKKKSKKKINSDDVSDGKRSKSKKKKA